MLSTQHTRTLFEQHKFHVDKIFAQFDRSDAGLARLGPAQRRHGLIDWLAHDERCFAQSSSHASAAPCRAVPSCAEPGRAEPRRAEPSRAEPSATSTMQLRSDCLRDFHARAGHGY